MSGHIELTKEDFAIFKDLPRDEPIQLLHLVKLREKAAYPDGRQASGLEAYRAYGRESGPVLRRLGVRQVWIGKPMLTLIGPRSEQWDIAFIVEYPSGAAFIELLRDPVYRDVVKHRQAAVEDSRLIRMKPSKAGAAFGEVG